MPKMGGNMPDMGIQLAQLLSTKLAPTNALRPMRAAIFDGRRASHLPAFSLAAPQAPPLPPRDWLSCAR